MAGVLLAYLRRAGYDTGLVKDGREALQTWSQSKPNVVILDILLPSISGLEVLRRRRDAGDDTAVIVSVRSRLPVSRSERRSRASTRSTTSRGLNGLTT